MKTLAQIQKEVGRWSLLNFGSQQSMSTGANLYSLSPLLGIVEEIGEYEEASFSNDLLEMRDAIGDILIYACDFAEREEYCVLLMPHGAPMSNQTLTIAAGMLCHAALKRHQGIRGFDDGSIYRAGRNRALDILMKVIGYICEDILNTTLTEILNETWESVQKRDWKKNPKGEPDADAG